MNKNPHTFRLGVCQMDREYYDLKLKNQSSSRLKKINEAILLFDGVIHDQHELHYYKQQWRNPIYYRISLPANFRYKFILFTKEWLYKPAKVQLDIWSEKPTLKLKGNHNQSELPKV